MNTLRVHPIMNMQSGLSRDIIREDNTGKLKKTDTKSKNFNDYLKEAMRKIEK